MPAKKLSHNVESFDSQKDSILCTLKNLSEMISAFTEQQHQYVDHIRNYFKETSKDLDNSNNILQSIIKPVIQSVNKMSPLLAENIYSACDILRSDFDLLENHFGELFASKTCIPPVLTNKEHIRIFLMGEFSSGKTTFIQRLLGRKSGEIAAKPTTGLLVIHRVANDESVEVLFQDEFSIPNAVQFSSFLQQFGLSAEFQQVGDTWCLQNKGSRLSLSPIYTAAQIMQFVTEANDFSSAFKEISWTHKRQ